MPADIPPPNESDNEASLSWWMRHSEEPRAWGMSPHVGSAMQSFIRRCHAAESERDRLAERLRRAEELLEPFRTHVGGCSDAMCPNCRIYRYFAESNHTEKQP